MKKTLKRYVPTLALEFIDKSDYRIKEHLYIICDMLSRVKIYIKKDKYTEFIDIPASYFTEIIKDKNNFIEAKTWLLANSVIDCDGVYSKDGGKALGYKFNDKYNSLLTSVTISKPTLFKRVIKNINDTNNVGDFIKTNKDYLLSTLKIEYKKAITYIDNLYNKEIQKSNTFKQKISCIDRYNSYFMSISAINDGYIFMRKNKTNGRVDSNLTSLKKELKQFIYPKNLYQIDIVNSQPFFLYFLIKQQSEVFSENFNNELDKYLNWCRVGKFYENFYMEYNVRTGKKLDRPDVKKIVYNILFAKNDCVWCMESNEVFKFIFPNIFKFIYNYKKYKHNKLAIDLQTLESSMCIDTIVPELNKAGINHYTIHDAWLMDRVDTFKAENIIRDIFYKKFGIEPKLYPLPIN